MKLPGRCSYLGATNSTSSDIRNVSKPHQVWNDGIKKDGVNTIDY